MNEENSLEERSELNEFSLESSICKEQMLQFYNWQSSSLQKVIEVKQEKRKTKKKEQMFILI